MGSVTHRRSSLHSLGCCRVHSLSGTVEPEADADLEATEQVLRLDVAMHCESCANRIRASVSRMDSIRAITTDAERRLVTVAHGNGTTDDDILETIRTLGFEANPKS